jgi:oxygen-dependent protoporphyrinogen oxidase
VVETQTDEPTSVRDVVVVGAGIAGLTAAWELRDKDVMVLEAEGRVGGRMKSERRGDYWLSVGAHMFPGPGSVIDALVNEMGLTTLPIYGSLLGMAYKDKIVRERRAELYPFKLPLSLGGRLSFIRAGLKVRSAGTKYNELARTAPDETPSDVRARVLSYLGDVTFAEFMGHLHPEVDAIFNAMTNRMTAEPAQISAGCMASLFAHVWSTGDVVLARSLEGGAAELPRGIASALGDRLVLNAPVREIALRNGTVTVRHGSSDGDREVVARTVIVATTADVARGVIEDLPAETAEALGKITYGPMAVLSILTNETRAMPWDDVYSILVVDKSFNMFFNHASALRVPGTPRTPGGTLMIYAGAGRALKLFAMSDEEMRDTMLRDLHALFPETRVIVEDTLAARWTHTVPYAAPGRHLVQAALERGIDGRVFLAGDYIGAWTDIESAATTGQEAAAKVRAALEASPRSAVAVAE